VPRTVLASRVLAALAATALAGVGLVAAPALAAPVPGTLQLSNNTDPGNLKTGSNFSVLAAQVPAPCDAAATRYRMRVLAATATDPTQQALIAPWVTKNFVGPASAGLPGPLSVSAADTWQGFANIFALPIVPGRYEFTLQCTNNLGSVIFEEFQGDTVTFTSPTAWQVNDVASPGPVLVATTTTVTAAPASVDTGANVTLTANVSETDAAAPTGTVDFSVNGGTAVSAPVNASGVATTTVVAGASGTANVSAVYSGDTKFTTSTGSTSFAVAGVVVPAAATSSSLTIDPAAPIAGAAVALNGTVANDSSGGPVPVGSCEFLNGTTVLGTAPVSGTGTCSINNTFAAQGAVSLTLRFVPTDPAVFVGSTSTAVVVTVAAAPPTPPTDPPTTPTDNEVIAEIDGKVVTGEPTVRPGKEIFLDVEGFDPDENVTVTLEGETTAPAGTDGAAVGPRLLDTVVADSDGIVLFDFTVPASLAPGNYTLTFEGVESGESAVFAFVVEAAAVSTTPTTATGTTTTAGATTGAGGTTGRGGLLALTGASVGGALGLATLLLGAGAVALWTVRRRQGTHQLGTTAEPR